MLMVRGFIEVKNIHFGHRNNSNTITTIGWIELNILQGSGIRHSRK